MIVDDIYTLEHRKIDNQGRIVFAQHLLSCVNISVGDEIRQGMLANQKALLIMGKKSIEALLAKYEKNADNINIKERDHILRTYEMFMHVGVPGVLDEKRRMRIYSRFKEPLSLHPGTLCDLTCDALDKRLYVKKIEQGK